MTPTKKASKKSSAGVDGNEQTAVVNPGDVSSKQPINGLKKVKKKVVQKKRVQVKKKDKKDFTVQDYKNFLELEHIDPDAKMPSVKYDGIHLYKSILKNVDFKRMRVGGMPHKMMLALFEIKFRMRNMIEKTHVRYLGAELFATITSVNGAGKYTLFTGNHPLLEGQKEWKNHPLVKGNETTIKTIEKLGKDISRLLNYRLGGDTVNYLLRPGVIFSCKEFPQIPHCDFGEIDDVHDVRDQPWIMHCPICLEGMWLNIWPSTKNNLQPPVKIHIPFGTYALLRGDVVHGGVFGGNGNVRFHMVFMPEHMSDLLTGADLNHETTIYPSRNPVLTCATVPVEIVSGDENYADKLIRHSSGILTMEDLGNLSHYNDALKILKKKKKGSQSQK